MPPPCSLHVTCKGRGAILTTMLYHPWQQCTHGYELANWSLIYNVTCRTVHHALRMADD